MAYAYTTRDTLTPAEIALLQAYRAQWPDARVRKYHKHATGKRGTLWQLRLFDAWMYDWEDQYGALRALRNSNVGHGVADIFKAFARADGSEVNVAFRD